MINFANLAAILRCPPAASACVRGNGEYAAIRANVYFYSAMGKVLVVAMAEGLPRKAAECANPVFGFHIHGGGSCTGNDTDLYADAMTHYNPKDCPHPYHAGDMPPLFGNNGEAFMAFMTDRFTIEEIIGKTVIIHSNPDDFTTQPSGNSGVKIACGVIK